MKITPTHLCAFLGGLALTTVAFAQGDPAWPVFAIAGAVFEVCAVLLVVSRDQRAPPLPVVPVGSRVVLQPGAGRVTVASP
ncbi:MAG: hypothetical protein ACRDD1_17955, partial [Planctomycetia bacterium]